jgi:hypothetical protein
MHQRCRLQPVAQGNVAESMAKMPDLAVPDEVDQLVLDCWDSCPLIPESYGSRPVENVRRLQNSHLS